jgi:hypothetical protein
MQNLYRQQIHKTDGMEIAIIALLVDVDWDGRVEPSPATTKRMFFFTIFVL